MDYTDAFILGALIGEYFGQDDEDWVILSLETEVIIWDCLTHLLPALPMAITMPTTILTKMTIDSSIVWKEVLIMKRSPSKGIYESALDFRSEHQYWVPIHMIFFHLSTSERMVDFYIKNVLYKNQRSLISF